VAKRKKKPERRRSSGAIQVQRASDGESYELSFPPSVRQRTEDMEEVQAMLAAGETEIATEELRWLLGGCHELLEAHYLLGKVAAESGNRDLARAHFGYAFKLGTDAIPKRGLDRPLPHANPANRAFHEAGAGLAKILLELKEANKAKEVALQLLALDPTDPLGVKEILG
jgi:tetratricopeptide (TPR) repeat protein